MVWRAVSLMASESGSRGLPGAAAGVTGDDAAPGARAGIAGEPAAARGMRGADLDLDSDAAGAIDGARNTAAAGGGDPAPGHTERDAVTGAAGATRRGKHHVPDTVISTKAPGHPGVGSAGRDQCGDGGSGENREQARGSGNQC